MSLLSVNYTTQSELITVSCNKLLISPKNRKNRSFSFRTVLFSNRLAVWNRLTDRKYFINGKKKNEFLKPYFHSFNLLVAIATP